MCRLLFKRVIVVVKLVLVKRRWGLNVLTWARTEVAEFEDRLAGLVDGNQNILHFEISVSIADGMHVTQTIRNLLHRFNDLFFV